uniref:Uncharacterized protein n=1 Tax=Timema tahoe TaxID=61484 RepID=A0A7R9NX55_9NEOP|nr:unnamed protein product [Timema tahoe]
MRLPDITTNKPVKRLISKSSSSDTNSPCSRRNHEATRYHYQQARGPMRLPDITTNKPVKRPISKSTSSESGSDPGLAAIPVDVTVTSRVEVKAKPPLHLHRGKSGYHEAQLTGASNKKLEYSYNEILITKSTAPSSTNTGPTPCNKVNQSLQPPGREEEKDYGLEYDECRTRERPDLSTTSTSLFPSTRQPPRKKVEEVSGFVIVSKQSYFKPIRDPRGHLPPLDKTATAPGGGLNTTQRPNITVGGLSDVDGGGTSSQGRLWAASGPGGPMGLIEEEYVQGSQRTTPCRPSNRTTMIEDQPPGSVPTEDIKKLDKIQAIEGWMQLQEDEYQRRESNTRLPDSSGPQYKPVSHSPFPTDPRDANIPQTSSSRYPQPEPLCQAVKVSSQHNSSDVFTCRSRDRLSGGRVTRTGSTLQEIEAMIVPNEPSRRMIDHPHLMKIVMLPETKGVRESLTETKLLPETRDTRERLTETRDPRERLTETRDPRERLTETRDPRERLTETRDPRERLTETRDPRERLTETRDPRERLMEIRDPRERLTETRDPRERLTEIRDPRERLTGIRLPPETSRDMRERLMETVILPEIQRVRVGLDRQMDLINRLDTTVKWGQRQMEEHVRSLAAGTRLQGQGNPGGGDEKLAADTRLQGQGDPGGGDEKLAADTRLQGQGDPGGGDEKLAAGTRLQGQGDPGGGDGELVAGTRLQGQGDPGGGDEKLAAGTRLQGQGDPGGGDDKLVASSFWHHRPALLRRDVSSSGDLAGEQECDEILDQIYCRLCIGWDVYPSQYKAQVLDVINAPGPGTPGMETAEELSEVLPAPVESWSKTQVEYLCEQDGVRSGGSYNTQYLVRGSILV